MVKEVESEAEAVGRSVLLHAVSTVLEFLPWAEARCFHNIMMLKIEQGRLSWSSNFKALADQFLNRKVRLNLKSSTYAKNKHFRKFRNRDSENINVNSSYHNESQVRSYHSIICRLWNRGVCSYGNSCKRWHVCLVCARNGKVAEPYKASMHGRSYAEAQGDPPRQRA